MDEHAWCRDIQRDEAVRAAEDNRSGPLPTLEEAISRAGQSTPQEARQEPECPERESVTGRRPPEPGGSGNVTGLRTERVTLEVTHSVPVAAWDWTHIIETYRPGESVRVVEEAKLAPAANADGGSNHAAPQPAPGWLTAEERRLIEIAVKAQRDPYDITGTSQYNARVLRDLLARSTPPEVVLPALNLAASPTYVDVSQHRDAEWHAALADAGVKVKEVGRE